MQIIYFGKYLIFLRIFKIYLVQKLKKNDLKKLFYHQQHVSGHWQMATLERNSTLRAFSIFLGSWLLVRWLQATAGVFYNRTVFCQTRKEENLKDNKKFKWSDCIITFTSFKSRTSWSLGFSIIYFCKIKCPPT